MSVFVDAQPRRAHYRTFAVRGLEGQDDFAAMGQVVSRRFARLRDAASPDRWDESFATIPNLVVIDGGKGQLAAALEAIHATYDLPRVAVVALAKREEEVFVPGRSAPIRLDRHDAGLQLLQRARDEAHRFALGFHRRRRDTRAFESIFDDLEGIGPTRRRAILNHFGSAEAFVAASQEELEGVPGLPAKTARAVYAQLHKAGPRPRRRQGSGASGVRRPARLHRAPEADGAEREEDRGEADDDVDDGDRQPHPDAEGEQRRARDVGAAEGVDEERLLGADPAGRRRARASRGSSPPAREARCGRSGGSRTRRGRTRSP